MNISLTVFQGRAGDHNDLAIPGAKAVADQLAADLGIDAVTIGYPEKALNTDWRTELDHALPALRAMQARFEEIYADGSRSIAATSRCAVSLATLPIIARYHPDACVVWFDSHGDLNTPDVSATGYLGGLAVAGPLGMWDSGLGGGLPFDNLILVGQRDLDPFEIDLIRDKGIPLIKPDDNLATQLEQAIHGRPVYVHLDCDVLNPGIVPTDYVHEGGLSLEELRRACEIIARSEVVGVEIAEFQNSWTRSGQPVSPKPLIDALNPLIDRRKASRI